MRNCFTKITNVFRKKNTQTSSERGHQAEEEYLRDDVYTRKETTTTDMMATARVGAVSECTSAADNQTSHNNDEDNDKNVIEQKKISISSNNHYCDGGALYINATLDKQQNAIKKTTPSLASYISDSQCYSRSLKSYRKKFNKASDPKTKSIEKQVTSALISQELNKEYEKGQIKVNVLQGGRLLETHNRPPNETWESKRQVNPSCAATTRYESEMAQSNALGDLGVMKVPAINFIMSPFDRRDVLQVGAKALSADWHSRLSLPTVKGFDVEYKKEVVAVSKTPEDIEYDAKVAAESQDVMTPLPGNAKHQLTSGRNAQSEIVEVIRALDPSALRINNLTIEDKADLMCRSENKHQNRWQSRINNHVQSGQDELLDSGIDGVILRRKCPRPFGREASPSGLYERRQPTSPKLKLVLEKRKADTSVAGSIITASNNMMDSDSERNLCDVKCPTVLPPNPQLKALLVFHKIDNIYEVMQQACNRHQVEVTLARTRDNALENLCGSTEFFHIIIIDARSPKHLDAEHIARSIRHMNGHHFTTIITVVKKSIFDRDDVINALLDAGVNRCMAESTSISMCSMELKQILHSIVRPHNVISTQQALYTALHRLKEVLIITDDLLRIQYANRSAERLLNMRLDEVISKPLAEIFVSDVSSINNSTQGKIIREFDGILTVRRKNQEGIPMHVRVVPVACIGRTPTHFVFNFDVPGGHTDFIATLPQQKEAPRGSLHSIRRGSFDVRSIASDGLRRTSLAKLTSLPLEAPITKIINLLSQVQENCSSDEARLIDKVMEFLKREGLYSPQMKEMRTDDPIATDLIGALLTGPNVYSSRRSSNDSIVRTNCGNRQSTTMPSKMKATPLIMEILEESLNWEFNIFKLEEVTERHPLLYLGMEIFRRFDVFATLNVDEAVCKNWLAVIERNYHEDNSYHNSTHAADVMQATGVFITQLAAKDLVMDRLEEAAALIAAAAHDVDHPGRSSAFLCNSNSPLAILYNDLTVLESHHASTTFRLTLGDDNANIFKNLDTDTYKLARTTIIDMILATEMTRHFEHLAKFVSIFGSDMEPRDIVQAEDESSVLMRRMLIKVADVSNPARPMICCIEWSRRIAEEYFMQTDEEKAKSLPIVMPMFDRGTCSIPKSQIGFIEYIIQDMMHAWDSFIDMPELITYMQINYAQWKKFEEQGIHTLAEVKTKQMSLMNKKSALK